MYWISPDDSYVTVEAEALYGLLDELSDAAYERGDMQDAMQAIERLLTLFGEQLPKQKPGNGIGKNCHC